MSENNFYELVQKYIVQVFPTLEKICVENDSESEEDLEYEEDLESDYEAEEEFNYEKMKEKNEINEIISGVNNQLNIVENIENEDIIKLYCSFCDESIENNKFLISPCEHFFHRECISKILNSNETTTSNLFNNCKDCNYLFDYN